ncbi:hypothetical protein PCE1_002805 [Barthelona sp. PCE]
MTEFLRRVQLDYQKRFAEEDRELRDFAALEEYFLRHADDLDDKSDTESDVDASEDLLKIIDTLNEQIQLLEKRNQRLKSTLDQCRNDFSAKEEVLKNEYEAAVIEEREKLAKQKHSLDRREHMLKENRKGATKRDREHIAELEESLATLEEEGKKKSKMYSSELRRKDDLISKLRREKEFFKTEDMKKEEEISALKTANASLKKELKRINNTMSIEQQIVKKEIKDEFNQADAVLEKPTYAVPKTNPKPKPKRRTENTPKITSNTPPKIREDKAPRVNDSAIPVHVQRSIDARNINAINQKRKEILKLSQEVQNTLETVKDIPTLRPILGPRMGETVTSGKTMNNGKKETVFSSGRRVIQFANGTVKEIFPFELYSMLYGNRLDCERIGHIVFVFFENGDVKQVVESNGCVVYFYADVQTIHVTFQTGIQLYKFKNQQIEKHYPDAGKQIFFPDGTIKTISEQGVETSLFVDGTLQSVYDDGRREVDFVSGQREVFYPDGSKTRIYPDGAVKHVDANKRVIANTMTMLH